jgi:beta-N-acetylhexosaminidase
MKFLLSLVLVFTAVVPAWPFAGPPDDEKLPRFWPSDKSWKWADKQLRGMTVDEKIGQLIHVGVNARFANQDSAFYKELRRHVVDNKVGGIIFFVGPVYETVHLANRMQEAAKIPLLMSVDAETGVGMRLENAINFPWAMAVTATGNPEYARRMGVITGREARATGLLHVFAPVLDVNNNAANPVINVRSFGEDPAEVGRFANAFTEGLQSQNVLATAKHFPGHGDTDVDSHRGLPVINHTREQLEKTELLPFRSSVEAGVASVMIGHIGLPQIDNEQMKPLRTRVASTYTEEGAEIVDKAAPVPASLSAKVQTDILRNDMGFKGLIVSDALDMSGLTIYISQEDAGVRALLAGTDMLLKPANADAMIRGLRDAVASGRVSESRLNESVRKVLAWKHQLGLAKNKLVPLDPIDRILSGGETAALADEIGEKAVTLVRNNAGLLPLDKSAKIAVLGISNGFEGPGTMGTLSSQLRQNGLRFASAYLQENSTADQVAAARKAVAEADVIVAGLYGRVRTGARNSVGLPENGAAILKDALASGKKVVGISFGNPYLLSSFPEMNTYIVAYSEVPSMQRAAARAILGVQDFSGRLPISLPGLHPRGTGLSLQSR